MQKNLQPLILAPALLLLTACDSAPSDADVQQAMRSQMEKAAGKDMAQSYEKDIASMKVLDCKKGELKAYECSVATSMGARQFKFVKADKGWMISQ